MALNLVYPLGEAQEFRNTMILYPICPSPNLAGHHYVSTQPEHSHALHNSCRSKARALLPWFSSIALTWLPLLGHVSSDLLSYSVAQFFFLQSPRTRKGEFSLALLLSGWDFSKVKHYHLSLIPVPWYACFLWQNPILNVRCWLLMLSWQKQYASTVFFDFLPFSMSSSLSHMNFCILCESRI